MFNKKLVLILVIVLTMGMLTGCTGSEFQMNVDSEETDNSIVTNPQKDSYKRGEKVTLTAYPKENFTYWNVETLGEDEIQKIEENPREFEIDNKYKIKAIFNDGEVNVKFNEDVGWIGGIMQSLLVWLYNFTNSYGLAIILLTLIVRAVLYPLVSKQTRSMKKMQKIQPLMEELKEKHGDDQEKLQEEMMKLYKNHKVNPASGCLPIFIQMPILIALFRSLKGWEELVGEPFLFISDLSASYLPLVFLTGMVMLGQSLLTQKMSASSNGNNKIAYMMPLFIIFIGQTLPAGVLLYWFTSTLIMTVQQYYLYSEPEEDLEGLKEESN